MLNNTNINSDIQSLLLRRGKYTRTEEIREKISRANTRERHPKWKGDKATYGPIHKDVRKYNPQPDRCQECSLVTTRLDLANVTGIYDRDFKNYRYLCRRCHMVSDGRLEKFLSSVPHELIDMSDRRCYFCKTDRVEDRHWRRVNGNWACRRCYKNGGLKR